MYHYQLFPKAIINFRVLFFCKVISRTDDENFSNFYIALLVHTTISSVVGFYSKFDRKKQIRTLLEFDVCRI